MKETKKDSAAFASPESENYRGTFGLTKREYFAALTMVGTADRQGNDYKSMAAYAVIAADELIAALNKEKSNER